MVDRSPPLGTHCRICGSQKLNKYYYALDLFGKVELYQLLRRDESLDELIRPCECRGEFAFAHRICLENWIETTQHEYCDICRFRYNLEFIERSFFDWIFETQQLKSLLWRACIIVLMLYICTLGTINSRRRKKQVIDILILTSSYIWLLGCFVSIAIYSYNGFRDFKIWKRTNRRVVVQRNTNPQLDTPAKKRDVLKSSGFRTFDTMST